MIKHIKILTVDKDKAEKTIKSVNIVFSSSFDVIFPFIAPLCNPDNFPKIYSNENQLQHQDEETKRVAEILQVSHQTR